MANPIENVLDDLFRSRALRVDAAALQGELQVVDRDALRDVLSNAVAQAENRGALAAAGGTGLSKMLDDYMRQNTDLRMKEQAARRRIQELEFALAEAKAGGGGKEMRVPWSLVEPHLAVDLSGVDALFTGIENDIRAIGETLTSVEDREPPAEIVTHLAEIQSEFDGLREAFIATCGELEGVSARAAEGSLDAAEALAILSKVGFVREKQTLAGWMRKSLDFLLEALGLE